jgi:hypothetical protein
LLEKAFSKLNGDYMSIVGGYPHDAIMQLLGTGGDWYYTSQKLPADINIDLTSWF